MRGNLQRSVVGLLSGLLVMLWLAGCAAPAAMPASEGYSHDAPAAEEAAPASGLTATGGSWDARARESHRHEESAAEAFEEEAAAEAWPESEDSAMAARPAHRDAHPHAAAPRDRRQEPVTAGVVDDNEQWLDYLDYRDRHGHVHANDVDVSERYLIEVFDARHMPVHDASVEIYLDKEMVFEGRTDAGGLMLFHPRSLPPFGTHHQIREFRVVASKNWVAASQQFHRYENETWSLQLEDTLHPNRTQLDLLFLVDATGSMGDEIAKLKSSVAEIADQIDRLPEAPDVRYGLVTYRDLNDAYVVHEYDFTHDLGRFQSSLARVRADGGGDEPESLNEALNRSIHAMSWRPKETVRLVVLVADAPPHLDYHWQPYSYETDMVEAVRRGIKLFPVGASGLSENGEYIFRQLAQFTGGKFVFLTYEDGDNPRSGPGTETTHDVDNYSVNTLDRLIVRLVREELAKLSQPVAQQQPTQVDSPLVQQSQ